MSPQIAKELRARQGTSTPFYFGVKTILKVRPSYSTKGFGTACAAYLQATVGFSSGALYCALG